VAGGRSVLLLFSGNIRSCLKQERAERKGTVLVVISVLKIAAAVGAQKLTTTSNECVWDSERIVIKCAGLRTTRVGASLRMLRTLDAIFGAFQDLNGSYRVLRLPAHRFTNHMAPTGKVGVVSRAVFLQEGALVSVVRC
jgi:hypothetical protein